MGVRMIVDPEAATDAVAIYDSVTGTAFGPVFASVEEAEAFLEWLPEDARRYTTTELVGKRKEWLDSLPEDGPF